MKVPSRVVFGLIALFVVAGCASTAVSNRQAAVNDKLPRPNHIWVYDFAATAADVPADSSLTGQYSDHPAPQTREQIATGRKVGTEIATQLVARIRSMGLPGERASMESRPQINDLVIRGYLLSVDQGSAAERVAIGFGAGGSELRTAVEGYQMTAQGLRRLGSGTVDASGSKTPGAALGVATFLATANPAGLIISSAIKLHGEESGSSTVEGRAEQTANEIASALEKRFAEQGWMQ
jgi:hypothetical protein